MCLERNPRAPVLTCATRLVARRRLPCQLTRSCVRGRRQATCRPGRELPTRRPLPDINLSGFAANYATTTTEGPPPASVEIGKIMLGFDTKAQLPVLYELATEFANWFSRCPARPGPTASSSTAPHRPA